MKTSLYAYFGLIDLHAIDSPGHSLYQLGLIDSISNTYGDKHFDFYSYYPKPIIEAHSLGIRRFPDDALGQVFNKYSKSLFGVDTGLILSLHLDVVLNKIKNQDYRKIYLKARFRNLSTLRKKWLDALEFETIIDTAISAGYDSSQIVILDTDLSLSEKFVERYRETITILTPSIDFPGISSNFLIDCLKVHDKTPYQKDGSLVFYGNLDTSNYKEGNSKSSMLQSILKDLDIIKTNQPLKIISKDADFLKFEFKRAQHIARNNRFLIWDELCKSNIMINITKEKYTECQFIPARVYEAMIFGMIPVSLNFNFLSQTFTFSNPVELYEILYYLNECSPLDYKKAFSLFINEYFTYVNSKLSI